MNLSRFAFLTLCLITLFMLVPASQASSIKERMAARIPAINALKDQGAVGENNRGFLEYRVQQRAQEQMITEENNDRRKVYEAIGKSQGAPAELVGQRRAKMIADRGVAGRWYQKEDGSWYKK